jgi:hypothetical protein
MAAVAQQQREARLRSMGTSKAAWMAVLLLSCGASARPGGYSVLKNTQEAPGCSDVSICSRAAPRCRRLNRCGLCLGRVLCHLQYAQARASVCQARAIGRGDVYCTCLHVRALLYTLAPTPVFAHARSSLQRRRQPRSAVSGGDLGADGVPGLQMSTSRRGPLSVDERCHREVFGRFDAVDDKAKGTANAARWYRKLWRVHVDAPRALPAMATHASSCTDSAPVGTR